jgi:hypothetical protein
MRLRQAESDAVPSLVGWGQHSKAYNTRSMIKPLTVYLTYVPTAFTHMPPLLVALWLDDVHLPTADAAKFALQLGPYILLLWKLSSAGAGAGAGTVCGA